MTAIAGALFVVAQPTGASDQLRTEGQKRGTKYLPGSGKAAPVKAKATRKKAGKRKLGKRAGKRAKKK